ncbi:MAG: cytochrome c family protein [Planctomycetes bacterium]|nr:cytochrome c family protein [Planctomycetota bacterium]
MRPGFTLLGLAVVVTLAAVALAEDKPKGNKYVGVEKCKNCHEAKSKGGQYTAWKAMDHAKAYEALASDEAKKIAKEKGIANPQTDPKCIKCHQTAYGEPAENIAPGFNPNIGVQCESCHGPGGNHIKARMAAADEEEEEGELATIPENEIVKKPPVETCKGCHNEESPQYKPFCYKAFTEKIRHLDPRKKRTAAELEAMKCKGDCGVTHDKK